jgi:hypothetical protein
MILKNIQIIACIALYPATCIQAMEEDNRSSHWSDQEKLAIQCLQNTAPKKLLPLMERMRQNVPINVQSKVYKALTGFQLPHPFDYGLFPEELLVNEVGHRVEVEARESERAYIPAVPPAQQSDLAPYTRQFLIQKPRFTLADQRPIEVSMDMYEWDATVHQLYLKNIDGAVIPLRKKWYEHSKGGDFDDREQAIFRGAMPGRAYILKQFKDQNQKNNYIVSQELCISSSGTELSMMSGEQYSAEFTIDAEINPSNHLTIYTRTHSFPDSGLECKRIYTLEEQSHKNKTFFEALDHLIVHEIKKNNMNILGAALPYYLRQGMPSGMVTKLRALASCDLSSNANRNLHLLLSGKKYAFGVEEVLPRHYTTIVEQLPPDAQTLVHRWGFRKSNVSADMASQKEMLSQALSTIVNEYENGVHENNGQTESSTPSWGCIIN